MAQMSSCNGLNFKLATTATKINTKVIILLALFYGVVPPYLNNIVLKEAYN